MTDRRLVTPAPAPLEASAQQFDGLLAKLPQRNGFRRDLPGRLLPTERHKSLTGWANPEPVVGAQHRRAQALQGFLCESAWLQRALPARRPQLQRSDPLTAPSREGVLAIDEPGDRPADENTAPSGRPDLWNLGKMAKGVVKVEKPVGRCAGG